MVSLSTLSRGTGRALGLLVNVGAVLCDPPKRGTFTFTAIEDCPVDWYRKRGRRKMIAEIAVEYAIPGAARLAMRVWRVGRDEWVRVV